MQKREIRVCFVKYCKMFGVEKAGGLVYDLEKVDVKDIEKYHMTSKNWVMVDENYKYNVILAWDDMFDSDQIYEYFENTDTRGKWNRKLSNYLRSSCI